MELISTLAEATLIGGMQIVFEAIDPNTGANVTGVEVSAISILCDTASGAAALAGGTAPVDDSAPVFVPLSLDDLNL